MQRSLLLFRLSQNLRNKGRPAFVARKKGGTISYISTSWIDKVETDRLVFAYIKGSGHFTTARSSGEVSEASRL